MVSHSGREKSAIVHKTEPAELQAANEVIVVKVLTPKKSQGGKARAWYINELQKQAVNDSKKNCQ